MKNLILLAGIVIMVSSTSCGQKLDASKVPVAVKEAFNNKFTGTTPKWEKEDGKYEAMFKYQGNEMSALFDANGTMTESEMEIEVAALPSLILNYVKNNYSNAKIKEAAKITNAAGEIQYEAEIKGKDLIFDSNGNFIKEVKN